MLGDFPTLTHAEQQAAVERIQELMSKGVSSGEAIQMVADAIRQEQAEAQE